MKITRTICMATFCRALWEAFPRSSLRQAVYMHVTEWIRFYHFKQQETWVEKLNNLHKVASIKG